MWACIALAILPLAYRQVTVSDAWWHAALGKWLVETWRLPDLSRFYFSPVNTAPLLSELRWQWLGDILLYFVYAIDGASGIQWLVVACLVTGLVFLSKIANAARGPWILLLLVAVALGTYQLQLARNSVYSLVFYPALLWLGTRKSTPPDWREYAWLLALLALWSCMHGSCALGWITACALYGPRALAAFRTSREPSGDFKKHHASGGKKNAKFHKRIATLGRIDWRGGLHSMGVYAMAMALCLLLISIGRRDAMHFLGLPFRHLSGAVAEQLDKATVAPAATQKYPSNEAAIPTLKNRSLKEWLNSSIWKRDPAVPWSNDYWSPLDMLPGMKPIEAAYGLAILAAACALIFRNVPAGLLLAWLGAVFLGLGYVRMFGYTALASGAVILFATRTVPRKTALQAVGWTLLAAWIGFAWWMFFQRKIDAFIPDGQHVSLSGQVPIYDEATVDWVRREFPEEPVFTTIESGSYCVLRWGFEKQVFLDGFFAPHTSAVWNAYHAAMRQGDLRPLEQEFGVRIAIIPTTSKGWVGRFLENPRWNPVAVGNGTVVFAHKSIDLSGRTPALLASASSLQLTSHYFREATLRTLFQILAAAKPGQGFPASQWTADPAFEPLRKMAAWVFPKL